MNQLLRRYEIPSCTSAGFTSLSKKFDFQTGYEKSMGTVISAISGGNLHIFQGGTMAELVYDPVLSILDDDIAGWVGRLMQGIDVNADTLAIDLINDVGPVPGHFLNTAHTRKHWRDEHFFTKAADQEAYPTWLEMGKKDALALAQERMDDILTNHHPEPLTDDQERAVARMLTDAREHYRKEGMISDKEWAEYSAVLEGAG
jgi:trimethylamine--corrinoid protein Co-methyltransferase